LEAILQHVLALAHGSLASGGRGARFAGDAMSADLLEVLEGESWLASRVRDHGGACELDGAATAEQRRERIREGILSSGLSSVLVGRANGRAETYSAAYARLYRQTL
jgi:hypothetical protein